MSTKNGLFLLAGVTVFLLTIYTFSGSPLTFYTQEHLFAETEGSSLNVSDRDYILTKIQGSSLNVSDRDYILTKIQDWHDKLRKTSPQKLHQVSSMVADEMEEILGVPRRKGRIPTSVCGEAYSSKKSDYPNFFHGHEINCTTAPPFKEVATVLLFNNNESELQMSLDRSGRHYPLVPVIIASNKSLASPPNVVWQTPALEEADTWNSLAAAAKTPYIWLGRDVNYFSWDTKLERLVLQLEITDAIITASSTRETVSRKWSRNCYQVTFNNFRLEYYESYRYSENSCLHCKYAEGPFMMRKEDFLKYKLLSVVKDEELLFLDFFLRATQIEHGSYAVPTSRPVLVCPDSMAEVHRTRGPFEETRLGELVKWVSKYSIEEIQLPNTDALEPSLTCEHIKYNCKNKSKKGLILSPCCKAELRKFLVNTCDFLKKLGVDYMIGSGTLLGAVKFYDVLPWELDGDIGYDATKLTDIVKAEALLKEKNYHLSRTNMKKGFTKTNSKHWYIECWRMYLNYSSTSLIKVGGRYIEGPRNPGNEMRNRFGVEIYRHIEHWSKVGMKRSQALYKSGVFKPCPTPGYHTCLENFPADGDEIAQFDYSKQLNEL